MLHTSFPVNVNYIDICMISFRYNQVRQCSHSVEFDLVIDEVEDIDCLVEEAQKNLNWCSLGMMYRCNLLDIYL